MGKYFLRYAQQFESEGQWQVFKNDAHTRVAVSPEQAALERNVMIHVAKDKKDHAIHDRAKKVWAAAQHLWDVYDGMLAVFGDTQEKGLSSGTRREEFIQKLTLAWHKHKHGGNKPDATSVPPGKTNIDLACFLKLGPALLGGRNDVNFMPDAEHFLKAMDGRVHTRESQRKKKKQRGAEEHRERVGKNLGGPGAATGMQVLQQYHDSIAAVNMSKAIASRVQNLEKAMKYAPDDATKAMLAKCIVDAALGRMDFAASVRPPDTSPATSLLSTPSHPYGLHMGI